MNIVSLITHLAQGLAIGFVASVPLGPIGVLCIQRTLNRGRRSGFASGLGAATSDLVYALIAGFSVSMVMNFVEEQQQLLTYLGAVILTFLGLKIFFTDPVKQMRKQQNKRSTGLWQDYLSTFFLTITNPLAVFLFLGAFSVVGGNQSIYMQIMMLGGVFAGASMWWLILTLLVGLFRRKLTLKRLYYLNKIAGAIIVVLVIGALIFEFVKYLIS